MHLDQDRFLADLLPRLTCGPDVVIPPGDDCAALDLGTGELLLLAVDQVAGGIHYFDRDAAAPTPPRLAGRKLLARNLSDIGAMGGRPTHALLAVAVPRDTPEEWLREFIAGLLELARETGVALIGGDLGSARAAVCSLTIVGRVDAARVCRRDGARPGDVLVATGAFGGSLASGRHLTFTPRLAEGAWLAARGVRAMIDVSDGLVTDLGRLCQASRVRARLDLGAIPRTVLDGQPVDLRAALLDGEDYELLAAVPGDGWAVVRRDWPFATALTAIGVFVPGADGAAAVTDSGGNDLAAAFGPGFTHFP